MGDLEAMEALAERIALRAAATASAAAGIADRLAVVASGHGVAMTEQTPEGEPTTEVSVETPAKDETTVEVADPAPASTTHVETTVEQT